MFTEHADLVIGSGELDLEFHEDLLILQKILFFTPSLD